MKRTAIFCVVGIGVLVSMTMSADNLKVVEQNGHLSPVAIRVTYPNGNSRNLMLTGIGSQLRNAYITHQLIVMADGGASKRGLWLDSIAGIQGTSKMRRMGDEFVVTLKNGTSVNAMFSAWSDFAGGECGGEVKDGCVPCSHLFVHNEDDGTEKIDLLKVKSVEFVGPARKDKAGNAMFELWHYSPFTGERIPK